MLGNASTGALSRRSRKRRMDSAMLALLLIVGFGCQSQPDPQVTTVLNGRLMFQRHCIVCHGPQGTGAGTRMVNPPVPDLLSASIREKMEQGLIRMHDGESGGVLGTWRLPLEDQDASDVIEYVRLLQAGRMVQE